MAKRLMVKYECSRCTREWYVEFKKGEEPPDPPSFKMVMKVPDEPEVTVEYPELCSSCTGTVRNYASNISRQLEKKSPKRAKKEVEAPEGASNENGKATQPCASRPLQTSSVGSSAG